MKQEIIKPGVRYHGIREAARKLGCSQPHLSLILHGQRKPGKELSAKLRKLGIKYPVG